MTWKGILRTLNKVAAKAKDIEAVTSGDSKKMGQRFKNKVKNRLLNKLGFWKW